MATTRSRSLAGLHHGEQVAYEHHQVRFRLRLMDRPVLLYGQEVFWPRSSAPTRRSWLLEESGLPGSAYEVEQDIKI